MISRLWIVLLLAVAAVAQRPSLQTNQSRNSFEIAGVLVDAVTLQAIAEASVVIAPVAQRDQLAEFITGEDGRFHFANLAAGKYTLLARRRGYLGQALNEHDGFSSAVVVGPSTDSSNIVFRLPPEGAISGAVLDEAGEAVRDAQVMLFRIRTGGMRATQRVAQTNTDDEGMYRFGHLPPGQYLVAVEARVWYAQRPQPTREPMRLTVADTTGSWTTSLGGAANPQANLSGAEPGGSANTTNPLDVVYPTTFYAGTTDPSAASPINLKQGEKYVADVNLQPVPALHLQFPGGGTNPTQTRFVTLEEKLFDGVRIPVVAETRTGASGTLELLGVAPGQYTARIIEQGEPQQERAAAQIDAVSNGPVQPVEIIGAHVLISLLLDPGTTRPRESYLQLVNMNTRDYYNEPVTDKGDIEFKQPIPPGKYELALTNGRGEFIRAITALGAKVSGRTVEIKSVGTVKLKTSIGHGMGQVTGTVLRDGKPFAGAMVVLVPADPGDNAVIFRRDQSDSDGTFTLAGAIPGKYVVLAIADGWDMEWMKPGVLQPFLPHGTPIEVMPNGTYDVKVNLQQALNP